MRPMKWPGYPLLALEPLALEIIGRQFGQSLGAEDGGKRFTALCKFGMGRCGAGIGSLAAQFPLIQLTAGEIMAFGFPHHSARTQNSGGSSTADKMKVTRPRARLYYALR